MGETGCQERSRSEVNLVASCRNKKKGKEVGQGHPIYTIVLCCIDQGGEKRGPTVLDVILLLSFFPEFQSFYLSLKSLVCIMGKMEIRQYRPNVIH